MKRFPAMAYPYKRKPVELTGLLSFFYGDYGIPMILAAQFAQQRIKNLFKQEAGQVQDHLINLGISLPGNKTAEMGELMYALASSIGNQPLRLCRRLPDRPGAGKPIPGFCAPLGTFHG